MADRLLFDTLVLVDYLCGVDDAVEYPEGCTAPLLLSSVVVAELYAGVRDGEREPLAVTIRPQQRLSTDSAVQSLTGRTYAVEIGKCFSEAQKAVLYEHSGIEYRRLKPVDRDFSLSVCLHPFQDLVDV